MQLQKALLNPKTQTLCNRELSRQAICCRLIMVNLLRSSLSPPHNYTIFFYPFYSYLTSITHFHTHTSTPNPNPENPLIINYLTESFGFPLPKALSVCKRFPGLRTLEKPQSVVRFLKTLGFSDTHIRSSVNTTPQILCVDVENILKPKLQLFQDLGLTGSDLGKFFSKNSTLLTRSLNNHLVPSIEFLKKILVNDHNNQDLILVLRRCNWVANLNPETRLKSNVSYLVECGIVGSQLSMLLKRQPGLFAMRESDLRYLVSKVLDMGFSKDSRMLVHALHTVSSMKSDTLMRKLEVFQSFGFSEIECWEMFRRNPVIFRTSEEKLKSGLEFFMNTIKVEKTTIVHQPWFLMHNMEDRAIPRYRVLEVMKSKRLLKKQPSFLQVLRLPEDEFFDKFISRFPDNTEELLVAYKGHLLVSSEEDEPECAS